MKWAIFKDERGVLYCEPVNEGIQVWGRPVSSTKTNLLGKSKRPAPKGKWEYKSIFLDHHYSRNDYVDAAFEMPPSDYMYLPRMVYMQENHWGLVNVLYFVSNHSQGVKLQKLFRKLSPERSEHITVRRPNGQPHPKTHVILSMLSTIDF